MQYQVAYLGLYMLSPQKALNPRNAPKATFENCKFMKWAIIIFSYYLLKIISYPRESILACFLPSNTFKLLYITFLPFYFCLLMIKT